MMKQKIEDHKKIQTYANTIKEIADTAVRDKIVQWVIRKVEYLTPIEWTVSNDTDRWEGWFWSTGI